MKKLIGASRQIQRIREEIDRLAREDSNVVITGEPGVGKSVVAQILHQTGKNAAKPFAKLDVGALDEIRLRTIVQSILSSGEFLNPSTSDHGNFHLSDGATLILDELDSASVPAQGIVGDFLEGMAKIGSKIRLVVLLNDSMKNLQREKRIQPSLVKFTKHWEFLHIPALRERAEDIPELIEHFVLETAREMGLTGDIVIDVNAVAVLVRKEWKENVRELKTFVERAMLLSDNKEVFVLPDSLVDEQSELAQMLERIDQGVEFAIDRSMELIEKRLLERVLRKFEFNQSKSARFLKITEDTLRYRMKKLGIHNVER